MLTADHIKRRCAEAGLPHLAEIIVQTARPALSLLAQPETDDKIPVGDSKLGGAPDLPAGFKWPHAGKVPLAFIAQINLAHAARHLQDPELPRDGTLWFFYNNVDQTWGFDPKDRPNFSVAYAPAGTPLTRTEPPPGTCSTDDEDEYFSPARLGFEPTTTFSYPGPDSNVEYDDDRFSEDEVDELVRELLFELFDSADGPSDEDDDGGGGEAADTPRHQFLGHARTIQSPMEEECQLVSNGIYLGDELKGKAAKRAEELRPGAADWRLLLQVDSDDSCDMMWGDCGRIYFWIRRQDLAARDFSKCWLILQCY